ncbi:MAG TPA: SIMPL domain-containing protein [Azonexus sp.]|nr:SIMPL domain-containing protein [Azonexus sp.]
MKKTRIALLTGMLLIAPLTYAGATIELAAEASRPAANDMVRASIYSELTGSNPAELARRVNQEITAALKVIRDHPAVSVKSGQQSTYPIYGKEQKIESWRMRSELILESKDLAMVSDLIGKLQQMRLALGSVSQMPSPETRRKVEDETTRDAIRAFQSRAVVAAEQLGKTWKVKQLNIQQGSNTPIPIMRANRGAMLAEAAPAPLEAGESQVTTTISGQIELAD